MKCIEIKNVSKKYKNQNENVLNNINLTIEGTGLIAIKGESGSGKSTLLNLIGGLDLKYDGIINVLGKNLKKMRKNELSDFLKDKISFIFQSLQLIPYMNVLDNIMLIHRDKEKALKLLKQVGLYEKKNQKVSVLSGGEKQRVAIARALMSDPDIILADEPTGSLDSKNSMQILSILRNIANEGKLVIIVTHSDIIAASSDRIIEISDGNIINDITKKETMNYNIKNNVKSTKVSFLTKVKMSLYNIKLRKWRNIAIILGSVIGIMSVMVMLHVNESVKSFLEEKMSINDENKLQISKTNQDYFTNTEIENIVSLEGVLDYEYGYQDVLSYNNTLTYNNNHYMLEVVTTVMPGVNDIIGKMPKEGEILISNSLCEEMSCKLNEKIMLDLQINKMEKEYAISGIYKPENQNLQSYFYQIYIPYKEVSEGFKEPNLLILKIDNMKREELQTYFKNNNYNISLEEEMKILMLEIFDIITLVFLAIASLSIIVASIMIFVVIYINVIERTREIGILKSLGYKRRDIRQIFLIEAFFLSVICYLISILLSNYVIFFGNEIFHQNIFKIHSIGHLVGMIICFSIFMLGSYIPSRYASLKDVVSSFRYSSS